MIIINEMAGPAKPKESLKVPSDIWQLPQTPILFILIVSD